MRRILLLFSLCGFIVGTLAGLVGHFLMAPDGAREAAARPSEQVPPTFYLSGIEGAASNVAGVIEGAVRHRLDKGGALLAARPSECTVDLGATFTHDMVGEKAVVDLVWHVRTAQGYEIASVKMRNTVPQAMLHGDWSDDAIYIASTVEEALIRIVQEKPVPRCTVSR